MEVRPSPTEAQSDCVLVPCPIDCAEGDWSTWGDCHAACGTGIRRRIRYVEVEPEYQGLSCGSLEHILDCDTGIPCSAACAHENGVWDDCSETCGLNGMQSRILTNSAPDSNWHCPATELRSCSPSISACPQTETPLLPPAPTPGPTTESSGTQPRPVLTLIGGENILIEAKLEGTADPGATCVDPFSGDISTLIAVVGQIDGTTVGRYVLTYNCVDPVRNISAYPLRRIVTVKDTRCPQCTFEGSSNITVEASFPFVYTNGVTCTDQATPTAELAANTVELGGVDVEKVGTYHLTYRVKDHNGNWNDGNCVGTHNYFRTVNVVDTLKPVIGLKLDGEHLDTLGPAETSSVTNQLNPAHAALRLVQSQASMTRRLMALNGASTNSWWVTSAFAGAVGCAVVGAALKIRRGVNQEWRSEGELQILV